MKGKRKLRPPSHMVKICQICGDEGFHNALLSCTNCSNSAGHIYCLGLSPDDICDDISWICDSCASTDKQFGREFINGDKQDIMIKAAGDTAGTMSDQDVAAGDTPADTPVPRDNSDVLETKNDEVIMASSSRKFSSSKTRRVGGDAQTVLHWVSSREWSPKDLTVFKTDHISYRVIMSKGVFNRNLEVNGNVEIISLYDGLDQETKAIVDQTVFYALIFALRDCASQNLIVVRGLVERFWDITNTFHLPWGEMTITPLDFCLICGLPFGGNDVLVADNFQKTELEFLFGSVSEMMRGKCISLSALFEVLRDVSLEQTPEQKARTFLLFLLGSTLFANHRSRVNVGLAASLWDLTRTQGLDWGGAAYATLLYYLRNTCRSRSQVPAVAGLWRVVEIWFYEYFPNLAPLLHDNNRIFPAMRRWFIRNRIRNKIQDLNAFRVILNESNPDLVNWHPWDDLDKPSFAEKATYLSSCRLVFCGPVGWTWYLGERVPCQSINSSSLTVPFDPPSSMVDLDRVGESLNSEFRQPKSVVKFINTNEDYEPFRRRLMGPLVVAGVSRPIIPSLKVQVYYPHGTEVYEVPAAGDDEIERWPLPPDCPRLNREESKEVLRCVSSLKKAVATLQKELKSLTHCAHPIPPPTRSSHPRGHQ